MAMTLKQMKMVINEAHHEVVATRDWRFEVRTAPPPEVYRPCSYCDREDSPEAGRCLGCGAPREVR
jgi:hypothetical protein